MTTRRFRAIGLMSGTSMDGIDVAMLETDGESYVAPGAFAGAPYPSNLRRALLRLPADDLDIPSIERAVTDLHSDAVRSFCVANGIALDSIDLIGFHGQTIRHEPEKGITWQLGDGQRMADTLGAVIVNGFRQNDMDHGGEGAPLAPAYHRAIVRSLGIGHPVAVLNIGGVSNVTFIDRELLYACDCGPGNALIDDWVSAHFGVPYDDGGRIAAAGTVEPQALAKMLDDPFFKRRGPKSLDRNSFSGAAVSTLSPEDGAATLSAFTAAAIAAEAEHLPGRPKEWIVVGGGRLNACLLDQLRARLHASVRTAEDLGWNGDAIEAQAFAYLAVRSALETPLSWPETTGVRQPVSGGVRWSPCTN
jgi:anhydro-N-acetylmuramic acid kinase